MSHRTHLSSRSNSKQRGDTPVLTQKQNLQKQKSLLIVALENQLCLLDQVSSDVGGQHEGFQRDDSALERLQSLSRRAASLQLGEIQRLCKLAMGKRILNIELNKKRDEHQQKLMKKDKIRMFARSNRIKRFDYDQLIEQKLKTSTLVAKAYDNARGFVESDRAYSQDYQRALLECDYMSTIKTVNQIFYKNYSVISKEKLNGIEIALKSMWVLSLVFIVMAFTFPFMSFASEDVLIVILLAVMLVVLVTVAIRTFVGRPNSNNQMQQTMEDIKVYFEQKNEELGKKGMNIAWRCQEDFLYLEAIFQDGFPHERNNCFSR